MERSFTQSIGYEVKKDVSRKQMAVGKSEGDTVIFSLARLLSLHAPSTDLSFNPPVLFSYLMHNKRARSISTLLG